MPPSPPPLRPGPAPAPFRRPPAAARRPRLGALLVARGVLDHAGLARALDAQARCDAPLGAVAVAEGLASEEEVAAALAEQAGLPRLDALPPLDAEGAALAARLPARLALRHRAVPVAAWGGITLVATARPEGAADLLRTLPPALRPARAVAAPAAAVEARIAAVHGPALARRAECRAPAGQSCRGWRTSRAGALVTGLGLAALLAAALAPAATLQAATLAGLAAMAANLSLRIAALLALRPPRAPPFDSPRARRPPSGRLPPVTVLVPLHREPEVVPALIARMARLDYPRAALEVMLVVEAGDAATRAAIAATPRPPWMREVPVPEGAPKTKPRAMNYALALARGELVAVYDAEDAPAPDQLLRAAARFAHAGPDLACLQGRLDFYNASRNWIARLFAVEYATWFRLVLPGLARLGLVIPLGGTTLFFRRAALEAAGAWDAHNVTEDADLGVRLARCGYRAEILDVTTLEEANAAPLAWVRQRSRWMKGYMMTWAVHAARPRALARDLGRRRAAGVHLLFGGAILDALFKPVMWSTVALAWGWDHPVARGLPEGAGPALALAMPALTLLGWAVAWAACAAPHHRRLRPWIPLQELYYPMATLAALKALVELVARPFHWDKTPHGLHGGPEVGPDAAPAAAQPRAANDDARPAAAIAAE